MGRATLWISLLAGVALGIWEVDYFTRANQLYPVGSGHLVAFIVVGLGFALGALAVSFLFGLLARGTRGRAMSLPAFPGFAFLGWVLLLSHYRERVGPPSDTPMKAAVSIAITVGFLAISVLLYRILARKPKGGSIALGGVAALLIVAGGTHLGKAEPPFLSTPPGERLGVAQAGGVDETHLRVLIVGLDGGTWKVIDPMMRRGDLPTLASLCRRGITADLKVVLPTFSPPLWTSIATGKSFDKNGIHDHYRTALPLGLPPVPHQILRCRTLTKPMRMALRLYNSRIGFPRVLNQTSDVLTRPVWDILDESGFPTIVLDWYVTYPVPPTKGIHVSDQLHRQKKADSPLPGLARPEEDVPALLERVIAPEDIPDERLYALLDTEGMTASERAGLKERLSRWFHVARSEMARDLTNVEVTRYVFPRMPDWRFAGVFFRAMDNSHHLTWHMKDLSPDEAGDNEEAPLHSVVERCYKHCDLLLQTVLELAEPDSNTVIIVMSDHGYENEIYAHSRAPDGFFVLAGGPASSSPERSAIHIYDVAPTVLALLGLPVGEDMDGRVAKELFDPSFWESHPVRTIPTYEGGESREAEPDHLQVDEESMDLLRALGYVQ